MELFENMDYIYEVYIEGSFSKAARNLYISQPSLSASVKRIEDRLGYPIFDRSTKPLRLTEFGKKYIDSMLAIRRIDKAFAEYINDYGGLKTGALKFGGTNLVSSLVAPKLINSFRALYPQIDVELIEGITEDLEKMLDEGTLDMVMDYSMPYADCFDYVKLADEYLVLTVPKEFIINEKLKRYEVDIGDIRKRKVLESDIPSVPLSDFKDIPFVLLKKKNDTYKRAMKMCADAGFEPKKIFESAQQMTAYHVCASGMGAAFVSSMLLSRVAKNPDLVYYKLDSELSRRELCLLWKKERYLTRTMEEFKKLAIKESANW